MLMKAQDALGRVGGLAWDDSPLIPRQTGDFGSLCQALRVFSFCICKKEVGTIIMNVC